MSEGHASCGRNPEDALEFRDAVEQSWRLEVDTQSIDGSHDALFDDRKATSVMKRRREVARCRFRWRVGGAIPRERRPQLAVQLPIDRRQGGFKLGAQDARIPSDVSAPELVLDVGEKESPVPRGPCLLRKDASLDVLRAIDAEAERVQHPERDAGIDVTDSLSTAAGAVRSDEEKTL